MPEQPPQPKGELPVGARIIRYGGLLFIIGAISVGMINMVYSVTKEEILRQQREKMLSGVRTVFNLSEAQTAEIKQYSNVSVDGKGKTDFFVHRGKDSAVKVACVVNPVGYGGPITLIVGYSPATNKLLGLAVVEQSETPSFGDKIKSKKSGASIVGWLRGDKPPEETELDKRCPYWFQQRFFQSPGGQQRDADEFKKGGSVSKADAITGATVTSQAVYDGIAEALDFLKRFNPETGALKP